MVCLYENFANDHLTVTRMNYHVSRVEKKSVLCYNANMNKIVTGILAHVDAGKTTLSENILYECGVIRKKGRVDTGDAFLDTEALEKERGITIFSKQAQFSVEGRKFTLLDTPGHVDFSPETERAMQVLDAAILLISGPDGVTGHTMTLWQLLLHYKVPVLIFVNKMDQAGVEKEKILSQIRERLGTQCIDYTDSQSEEALEQTALCEESLLDAYLEGKMPDDKVRQRLLAEGKLVPVLFGSALKGEGIKELLQAMKLYFPEKEYPDAFSARVYKIGRDEQGNRLTYLKVTGGCLKVKDQIEGKRSGQSQKINQIRLYQGAKYELLKEAEAGSVICVTGLDDSLPGEGLGEQADAEDPILEPVMTYEVLIPPEYDKGKFRLQLRMLEEEEPMLQITEDADSGSIYVHLMGEVQTQILASLIRQRYGLTVSFGEGRIQYKETIRNRVEGVGHFEPLRHYAEVHLLLEPGERGSGMTYSSQCSEDLLDKNWQRLILTHLQERGQKGVLIGAPLTDVKITLVSGKAHEKHTEGGDFREATYRAVRQGLMQADSKILEPCYRFSMELPADQLGRAMTDLEAKHGSFDAPMIEGERAYLTGSVPAAGMSDYQQEFRSYTGGKGILSLTPAGYIPCHNEEEILQESSYDPDRDVDYPSGSIFCAHGAGVFIPWDEVPQKMHLPYYLKEKAKKPEEQLSHQMGQRSAKESSEEELMEIFRRSHRAGNQKEKPRGAASARIYRGEEKQSSPEELRRNEEIRKRHLSKNTEKEAPTEEVLLVDGYNIIFAWDKLHELAEENMDAARGRLQDILCNYQGYHGMHLIIVYDAYRVADHETEVMKDRNIHIVFTKEAETADQYIEKAAIALKGKKKVTVATSDGIEQVIVFAQGARILSAQRLLEEVEDMNGFIRKEYLDKQERNPQYLFESVDLELAEQLENIRLGEKGKKDE
jgi:ribosomal protection tetracycline resistance protein